MLSKELFQKHYPKFSDRVFELTPEQVQGTNLNPLLSGQLLGSRFRAIPVPESVEDYFSGKYSPRYGMGIEFNLELLDFPYIKAGVWRAWSWKFFVPPSSHEGEEIIRQDDMEDRTAELSDLALV